MTPEEARANQRAVLAESPHLAGSPLPWRAVILPYGRVEDWIVEDCLLPTMMRYDLRRHDYYLLNVTYRQDVVLTLESPGINSTLALFTRSGEPVAEAMAIGEPGRIETQLAPGAYVIRVGVGSGAQRETGRYTLRVR